MDIDQITAAVIAQQQEGRSGEEAGERAITLHLLGSAKAAGFELLEVDAGGGHPCPETDEEALDIVFSVKECSIYFQKRGFPERFVLLILGNNGDLVADNSYSEGDPDGFESMLDHVAGFAAALTDS